MVDWLDSAAGAAVDNFWVADDASGGTISNRAGNVSLTLVGSPTIDTDGWEETSTSIELNGSSQYLQASGISGYDGSFTIALAVLAPDIANNNTYWTINSSEESSFDNYRFLRNSFNRLQLVSRDNAGGATSSPLLGNTAPTVETVYVLGYDASETLAYSYEMKGDEAEVLVDGFTVSPQVEDIDTLFLFAQSINHPAANNHLAGHFKACATWTSFIGEEGALAVAEAIYDNANAWPSEDNGTTTGTASVTLSGAAVGGSLFTANGAGNLLTDAEAIGRSLATAAGTASVSLSGTATGQSSAVASGTASINASATAEGASLALSEGSAELELSGSATGSPLVTSDGQAQVAFSAQADSSSAVAADGSASVSLSATATGVALATAAGSASVSLSATAASQLFSQGSATVSLSATGVGGSLALSDGTANMAMGALAEGVTASDAVGAGSATVTIGGTAQGRSIATSPGTASVSLSGQATGAALALSAGSASFAFSATAEQAEVVSTGTASIAISAQAEGASTHIAAGSATLSISALGLTPDVIPAVTTGYSQFAMSASAAATALATGDGDASMAFTVNGKRQVLAELVQNMGEVSTRRRTVVGAPNRKAVATL